MGTQQRPFVNPHHKIDFHVFLSTLIWKTFCYQIHGNCWRQKFLTAFLFNNASGIVSAIEQDNFYSILKYML